MSGKLFVVSSPSGAGKTTLVNQVLGRLKGHFSIDRVVTYTSREPRSNEIPGKHYHFVSSQTFEEKLEKDFFLEWSGRYGSYYGTPRSLVQELEKGVSKILIIDRLGAERVMAIAQDSSPTLTNQVCSIWIEAPSLRELESRLVARGQEDPKQIRRRLELAKQEIEKEKSCPLYDHKIINDVFSKAVRDLEDFICCKLRG